MPTEMEKLAENRASAGKKIRSLIGADILNPGATLLSATSARHHRGDLP